MLYPRCYTTVDYESEKIGFLTRANAARFQSQPAQVIGPLGYVCTATDEFFTGLKLREYIERFLVNKVSGQSFFSWSKIRPVFYKSRLRLRIAFAPPQNSYRMRLLFKHKNQYGGHIEFIRFKEYYGMPRGH